MGVGQARETCESWSSKSETRGLELGARGRIPPIKNTNQIPLKPRHRVTSDVTYWINGIISNMKNWSLPIWRNHAIGTRLELNWSCS